MQVEVWRFSQGSRVYFCQFFKSEFQVYLQLSCSDTFVEYKCTYFGSPFLIDDIIKFYEIVFENEGLEPGIYVIAISNNGELGSQKLFIAH